MSRSPLAQTTQRPGRNNWRTATKRQILGNFSGENGGKNEAPKIDGTDKEHVRLLLEGLQKRYDHLVADLKSELEDNKFDQDECLSTGLIKLSANVKKMKVSDFNRLYKCNLLSILKSKDGVVLSGGSKPLVVDAKKKRCFETPAPGMRPPGQLNTIMRTARRGEELFSQNGSPLAATEPGTVIATVCKKRRGNGSANVEINVGKGHYISLNDPNGVAGLDPRMKQTAASQLKVLQDQMASLMAQLQQ